MCMKNVYGINVSLYEQPNNKLYIYIYLVSQYVYANVFSHAIYIFIILPLRHLTFDIRRIPINVLSVRSFEEETIKDEYNINII